MNAIAAFFAARSLAARMIVMWLLLACFFGAGWYTKAVFTDAKEVKTLRVEAHQSAANVVTAVAENARIETAAQKTSDAVTTVKQAVAKRGIKLIPKANYEAPTEPAATEGTSLHAAAESHPVCPGVPDLVLDVGTVGLLNDARQGRSVDPTSGSDEEKSAPSTVGVAGLVDNDLEVVRLYLDLARRHDELVDAVEKHLKDQAK